MATIPEKHSLTLWTPSERHFLAPDILQECEGNEISRLRKNPVFQREVSSRGGNVEKVSFVARESFNEFEVHLPSGNDFILSCEGSEELAQIREDLFARVKRNLQMRQVEILDPQSEPARSPSRSSQEEGYPQTPGQTERSIERIGQLFQETLEHVHQERETALQRLVDMNRELMGLLRELLSEHSRYPLRGASPSAAPSFEALAQMEGQLKDAQDEIARLRQAEKEREDSTQRLQQDLQQVQEEKDAIEAHASSQAKEVARLKADQEEIQAQLAKHEQEKEASTAATSKLTEQLKEAQEQLQKEQESSQKARETLEGRIGELTKASDAERTQHEASMQKQALATAKKTEELQQQLKSLKTTSDKTIADLRDHVQSQAQEAAEREPLIQKLKEKLKKGQAERTKVEQRASSQEQEVERLQTAQREVKEKLTKLSQEKEKSTATISDLTEQLERVQAQLKEAQAKYKETLRERDQDLEAAQKTTKDLQQQLESLETKTIATLQKEIAELQSQTRAAAEREPLIQRLKEDLTKIQKEKAAAEDLSSAQIEKLKRLQAAQGKLEEELAKLAEEKSKDTTTILELTKQLQQAHTTIEKLQQKQQQLEGRIKFLQESAQKAQLLEQKLREEQISSLQAQVQLPEAESQPKSPQPQQAIAIDRSSGGEDSADTRAIQELIEGLLPVSSDSSPDSSMSGDATAEAAPSATLTVSLDSTQQSHFQSLLRLTNPSYIPPISSQEHHEKQIIHSLLELSALLRKGEKTPFQTWRNEFFSQKEKNQAARKISMSLNRRITPKKLRDALQNPDFFIYVTSMQKLRQCTLSLLATRNAQEAASFRNTRLLQILPSHNALARQKKQAIDLCRKDLSPTGNSHKKILQLLNQLPNDPKQEDAIISQLRAMFPTLDQKPVGIIEKFLLEYKRLSDREALNQSLETLAEAIRDKLAEIYEALSSVQIVEDSSSSASTPTKSPTRRASFPISPRKK